MIIYLIGFMGSGKSTIGKLLATDLNFAFFDSDKVIEQESGQTIGEIFKTSGEDYFRKLEQSVLNNHLSRNGDAIIAVGGGMPCFFDNMAYMKKTGLTIYLKMSADAIFQRLKSLSPSARLQRPLLANKTDKELLTYIKDTLSKREMFYNQSELIILNEESDVHLTLERIKNAIKYLKK